MIVSVIIPTYRRTSDLCRCLEALKQQTRPAEEVLVVTRRGDMETEAFLADYEPGALPLRRILVDVPGVVAAMNAGLAEAQGDIIALTDDDTTPHADWMERIAAHFAADARLGGVGGRDWQRLEMESQPVVGKVQWHGRVIGNHHLGVGGAREVDIVKGANCAYRAGPLKDIGFETRLRGSGAQVHWELFLGLALRRGGWKLVYDPAIAVDHHLGQRFGEDLQYRGGTQFDAGAHASAIHNETLALLEYLPPTRRIAFLLWAGLLGTRSSPGLLQIPRLLARRGPETLARFAATLAGRAAGMRSYLKL